MGNPLVQRIPSTLAEYRSAGIEYVVTNGKGQRLMRNRPDFENNFPAFAGFYDELSRSRLIQAFDPDDWNGKGPVVWIYDIRESD